MARTIAISAVQTQTSAASPAELNELAGTQSANRLIVEEVAPRKLAMEAHIEEVKELKSSVDSARWDLKLRSDRVPLLEQALAMRQDRLKGLSKLAESGNVARPVLQQAQSEILDEQDRRQEILMSIDVAKDRLQKAEQDLRMRESEANVAGEKDFLNARTEAGNALADATSAIETIKAVAASTLATPPVQDIKFVVVRHSKCGSVPIAATDVTQLEPGDLVQATGSARSPQVEALGSNQ